MASNFESAATGFGAFLFPMSGLGARMKQKGMSRGRAGRPRGVYKHISPITGEPVHVNQWRKDISALRRQKLKQIGRYISRLINGKNNEE